MVAIEIWIGLIVIVILQMLLLVYAVVDWSKQPQDMPSRTMWLVIILVGGTIGTIVYLLAAPRGQKTSVTDQDDTWQAID
ncbi:MAG: PLDc N-terminal domain-containing protein [Candidatus Kariarchaeaceae archaeon]|jgi:hypothetical protein